VKRMFVLVLWTLVFPMASFANSNLVFGNAGGKITLQSNTMVGNSFLTSLTGNGLNVTGSLGTVTYKTGALLSGNVGSTAMFAAGGSFIVKSNGAGGLPSGTIFSGAFSGPVSWVGTFNPAGNNGAGNWTYVLTAQVDGTLSGIGSGKAIAATIQFTFDVPNSLPFSKSVRLNYGTTTVSAPENGTLGLLGTGLIGLAGLIRRKFRNTE
jgi:hypothetical protein